MAKKAAKATKPAKKPAAKSKPVKAAKAAAKPAKAVKAAPKAAPASKKPAPAPKKAEKVVTKAAKSEAVQPKEKPKLKLAPPVEETHEEVVPAKVAKKTEKAPAATKGDTAKVEAAPKSVKATLKLLKSDKGGDDSVHWQDLHDKFRAEKAQSYDMKSVFEAGKPLQHKVLGWGWVISNENDRLEVLFKDGRRTLISNYNPNR